MTAGRVRRLVPAAAFVALSVVAHAQTGKVKWSARIEPPDVRAGEQARIVVTGQIEPTWHIYGLAWPGATVIPTAIEVRQTKSLTVAGKPVQPTPAKFDDAAANIHADVFEGSVAFGLPVKVAASTSGQQSATVTVTFQACDPKVCMLPETAEIPVTFAVLPGPARPDRAALLSSVPPQPASHVESGRAPTGEPQTPRAADATTRGIDAARKSGILAFLWISMAAGLAAIFTPCVFPMIPITVSFFSKRKAEDRSSRVRGPLAYCLGIVATFTGLGVLVTVLFGATGVQSLAANPYLNIGLALLFIVLAANLFGVYEIIVPSWLVNKAHSGTGKGGLVGPLLMGLTFTLTSFTCTVPFAGTLLASAAAGGGLLYPIVGMLAFSAAFAAPFFFLAMFPQYLERLPKSGSWLTSVKAFMGFIELAAAAKFVSNVDMAWELRLLTRPVFLSVWATIFVVAALYLLGWMRLPHDAGDFKVGIARRLVGIGSAATAIYCLAAIEGAPLGQLEAFPPPPNYGRSGQALVRPTKWLEHYAEAETRARAENRAIFINFTGATCVNCRQMEANVLPRPDVVKQLDGFVPAQLYTDRANSDDKANQKRQLDLIGSTAQPVYAVVTPDGKLLKALQGQNSVEEFVAFLKEGRQAARAAGLR